MGTLKPNIIALMTEEKFNSLIPECLKTTAWHRATDAEGNLVYTQQTWKQMTDDPMFKVWYGDTLFIQSSTWKGESIGDRYVVKGLMDLSKDNVFGLKEVKLDFLLSAKQLKLYLQENNAL